MAAKNVSLKDLALQNIDSGDWELNKYIFNVIIVTDFV